MFSSLGVNKVTLSLFNIIKWTESNQTSLRFWEVQQNLRFKLYNVLIIKSLEFTSFAHTFRCTNSFRKADHNKTTMASFTTERISSAEYRSWSLTFWLQRNVSPSFSFPLHHDRTINSFSHRCSFNRHKNFWTENIFVWESVFQVNWFIWIHIFLFFDY